MSYRVRVTFETTEGKEPWMHAHDVVAIVDQDNGELPESNFVGAVHEQAKKLVSARRACSKCKTRNDLDANHCKSCGQHLRVATTASLRIDLKELYWSGNYASDSLKSVAPYVHGRLEAFFVGEDGAVFGGAILEDGTYTPCSVKMTLVPAEPTAG